MRCSGVILAGGRASRFGGRAKGLEQVGGERVIDRVACALRQATDELLLIANDPAAAEWLPGVRVAGDVYADRGSLAGIHAALVHAGGPALVVAWDMPFITPALLGSLRTLGEHADAAVPESDTRYGLEPFCAYYSPACIAPIERCLERNALRVSEFLEHVQVARLDAAAVSRFGDPRWLFLNVNKPDDLSLAQEFASTRGIGAAGGAAHPPVGHGRGDEAVR